MNRRRRLQIFGGSQPAHDDTAARLTVEEYFRERPRSELIFGFVRPSSPSPVENDHIVAHLMSALVAYACRSSVIAPSEISSVHTASLWRSSDPAASPEST